MQACVEMFWHDSPLSWPCMTWSQMVAFTKHLYSSPCSFRPLSLLSASPSLSDPLASWFSHPSPAALAWGGPAHPGSFIMGQEGSPWACRPLSAPAIASLWLAANKCRISKSLLKSGGPFSANWVRVTELLSALLQELFVSPPFTDTDPHKINDF